MKNRIECAVIVPLLDKRSEIAYNTSAIRGYGVIGRRVGFRFGWATVQVQVLLPVPSKTRDLFIKSRVFESKPTGTEAWYVISRFAAVCHHTAGVYVITR